MVSFKTFVQEQIAEAELSALQKEYQTYFEGMLKKYNVGSPAELSEEDMKKFFDEVSSGWVKGEGKK